MWSVISFFGAIAIAVFLAYVNWFNDFRERIASNNNDLFTGEAPAGFAPFIQRDNAEYTAIINAPFKARFIYFLTHAPGRRFGGDGFIFDLFWRFLLSWFILAALPVVIRSCST
jgi:hypothetical protein